MAQPTYKFHYERYDRYWNDYIKTEFFVEWDRIKEFMPVYNKTFKKNLDEFDFVTLYGVLPAEEWDFFHEWALNKGYSYKPILYPEKKSEDF